MKNDFFKQKADSYDTVQHRVENVDNIAQSMIKEINFTRDMSVMDFGSGTGLLLERIAPYVKKITAIDVSESMNKQLAAKKDLIKCELEIIPMDLTKNELNKTFNVIISSMTLHHIKDIESIFKTFHSLLKDNGILAISDLDLEDGSFHSEDTGVHHFGFVREKLGKIVESAGFTDIIFNTASIAEKPQGSYPIFLLVAKKV